MKNINGKEHEELLEILEELIYTIKKMRLSNNDTLLLNNELEANEWFDYLKNHIDVEEVHSLEVAISDRFFYKYDVQIEISELDDRRAELFKLFIAKACEICNKSK